MNVFLEWVQWFFWPFLLALAQLVDLNVVFLSWAYLVSKFHLYLPVVLYSLLFHMHEQLSKKKYFL